MNGLPPASSSLPGASPMHITFASRGPSPKTQRFFPGHMLQRDHSTSHPSISITSPHIASSSGFFLIALNDLNVALAYVFNRHLHATVITFRSLKTQAAIAIGYGTDRTGRQSRADTRLHRTKSANN